MTAFLQPETTWNDFPPVTPRERALPWYNERFKRDISDHFADTSYEEDAESDGDEISMRGPLAGELGVESSHAAEF